MNTEPSEVAAPVIVEDLFLTESFLIKGRIAKKYHRLAKMLEDAERTFLEIADAVMVSLRGHEVIRTPSVLVNQKEIILAHELVEVAGDSRLKQLATNDKSVRVRAFYSGAVQLELSGRIERGAYEPQHNGGRKYFTMIEPVLRGLNVTEHPELRCLRQLGYAIVQKAKLAYIYDFG